METIMVSVVADCGSVGSCALSRPRDAVWSSANSVPVTDVWSDRALRDRDVPSVARLRLDRENAVRDVHNDLGRLFHHCAVRNFDGRFEVGAGCSSVVWVECDVSVCRSREVEEGDDGGRRSKDNVVELE